MGINNDFGCLQGKWVMNERLREVRLSAGGSQRAFGERFGIAQQTYANYETGKVAVPDAFKQQLADMGVNIHWLVTGSGPMYLSECTTQSGDHPGASIISGQASDYLNSSAAQPKSLAIIIPDSNSITVPLVCQKLSAGIGQIWDEDSFTDDVIAIPTKMLKRYGGYKLGGAEVRGDSMHPTISNGDIVIFAAQMISGNGVYALSIDNEVFVKRLEFDPIEATVNVISDNEKYSPRLLPRDTDRIQILGKVIGRFMLYW
jgi:phage repressor protein C with HTH and peptisase S24 domain